MHRLAFGARHCWARGKDRASDGLDCDQEWRVACACGARVRRICDCRPKPLIPAKSGCCCDCHRCASSEDKSACRSKAPSDGPPFGDRFGCAWNCPARWISIFVATRSVSIERDHQLRRSLLVPDDPNVNAGARESQEYPCDFGQVRKAGGGPNDAANRHDDDFENELNFEGRFEHGANLGCPR